MNEKKNSIEHQPNKGSGTWVFDDSVAEVFDDMLERSVPLYKEVHQLIKHIITNRESSNGVILDLGVSTASSFINLNSLDNDYTFIGIDNSESMLRKAKENFPRAVYYNSDIQNFCNVPYYEHHRQSLDGLNFRLDIVICSLTLQFVPIEHRQFIIKKVYEHMNPSGMLFLFEKCLGSSSYEEEMYTDIYYKFKENSGYQSDNIMKKRKSLENVLVPVTRAMNLDFLTQCNFTVFELITWCNFTFWVGIK